MSEASDPKPMQVELQLFESGKEHADLQPFALNASEGLSTPFQVSIEARTYGPSDPGSLDPASWLNKQMAACLLRDQKPSWLHGVVVAVEHLGCDEQQVQFYRLELAPSISLMRHARRTRVFVNKKPLDVIRQLLGDAGLSVTMKAQGVAGDPPPRHITQFEESDFAFFSRLLEQEGACYWFEHEQSAHKLVIGDASAHHPGGAFTGRWIGSFSGAGEGDGEVTALARRFELVPKEAVVSDYSEKHPKKPALGRKALSLGKIPTAKGQTIEADYHATNSDNDASGYAARLADALACRACRLEGASGIIKLRSGSRLAVEGKDGYDEQMIIDRINHQLRNGEYSNTFSAVPASRLPWRPLRTTPVPRIDGLVPGIITAAAGAQGAGEDGAYRVKLLNADDANDRIVRMAQPYAGPAQGMHFPLPVETEVVLAHEYGHPDRPIIAGALHNAEHHSPVREENKSQCVVMSAAGAVLIFEDKKDSEKTTLQSKGTSKLEMDDKPGEEKVTLQSKAQHKLELDDTSGSEKVLLLTKGTQKLEFDDKSGSEKVSLYAKKDHDVKVDGKSDTAVKGKTTIDCQDEIEISAAKKLTIKVGSAKLVMESSGKITLEGTEIAITGKSKVAAEAPEVSLDGKAKVAVKGAQIAIEAQGTLDAKGNGPVTLQSSAITTVKGTMVMIN